MAQGDDRSYECKLAWSRLEQAKDISPTSLLLSLDTSPRSNVRTQELCKKSLVVTPLVSGGRGLSVLFCPTMSILHLSRSSPSGRRSLLSVSPLPEALRCAADIPDERATNPSSGAEAAQQMIANFENVSGGSGSGDNESYDDAEDTPEIKAAKAKQLDPDDFTYTERDVMLYNLGVGAKADELHLTYENAEGFAVCQPHLSTGHADSIASADFRCHSPIRLFLGSTIRFIRTQL